MTQQKAATEERAAAKKKAGATLYRGRWQERYQRWRANQQRSRKAPYAAQWRFLDAVHLRCVLEHDEEKRNRVNTSEEETLVILWVVV